eukprot:757597-Hanusia_phi.AAC.1
MSSPTAALLFPASTRSSSSPSFPCLNYHHQRQKASFSSLPAASCLLLTHAQNLQLSWSDCFASTSGYSKLLFYSDVGFIPTHCSLALVLQLNCLSGCQLFLQLGYCLSRSVVVLRREEIVSQREGENDVSTRVARAAFVVNLEPGVISASQITVSTSAVPHICLYNQGWTVDSNQVVSCTGSCQFGVDEQVERRRAWRRGREVGEE